MILVFWVRVRPLVVLFGLQHGHRRPAYHRLVKTTPNPSATKNNSGELVPPPPPPPPLSSSPLPESLVAAGGLSVVELGEEVTALVGDGVGLPVAGAEVRVEDISWRI